MTTIKPNPNPINSMPIESLAQYIENLKRAGIENGWEIADELEDLFIETPDTKGEQSHED